MRFKENFLNLPVGFNHSKPVSTPIKGSIGPDDVQEPHL